MLSQLLVYMPPAGLVEAYDSDYGCPSLGPVNHKQPLPPIYHNPWLRHDVTLVPSQQPVGSQRVRSEPLRIQHSHPEPACVAIGDVLGPKPPRQMQNTSGGGIPPERCFHSPGRLRSPQRPRRSPHVYYANDLNGKVLPAWSWMTPLRRGNRGLVVKACRQRWRDSSLTHLHLWLYK